MREFLLYYIHFLLETFQYCLCTRISMDFVKNIIIVEFLNHHFPKTKNKFIPIFIFPLISPNFEPHLNAK
jgi:hypothetical protein